MNGLIVITILFCVAADIYETGFMTRIVITGFGVFAGVTKNPSEDIVDHLKAWHLEDCDISTTVLVCSVENLNQFFRELDENLLSWSPTENVLLIHLGVDSGASTIKLETTAYNNMSFRVPDQTGYKPDLLTIIPTVGFDSPLVSCLDISALCEEMVSEKCCAIISTDPGRYLCNFIYYRSLCFCENNNKLSSRRSCQSMFIHVPAIDVITLEDQVSFVKRAVETLVHSISMVKA